MKRYAIIVGVVLVLVGAVMFWAAGARTAKAPSSQACTQEAKTCPDGSAVGRTGPDCQFAECPTVTATTTSVTTSTLDGGGGGITPYTSGVRGIVLLGPTCPVERIPPDPACADKPYATTIVVHRAGSSAVFTTGKSDAAGAFAFALPPGSYTLIASGGAMLPRCNETSISISPDAYATTTISCDTGIR